MCRLSIGNVRRGQRRAHDGYNARDAATFSLRDRHWRSWRMSVAPTAGAGDWRSRRDRRAPSAVHRIHAAQRPARDSPPRRERARRRHQRLVSRRVGEREARAHRVCASVRASDVRGIEARSRRLVRHMARGGRRQQQRIDDQRSHQLRHRRSVERARPRSVSRVGPHGVSARHHDAGARGRPAGCREERAASELRERAVRPRVSRSYPTCSIRRTIRTTGR